MHPLIYWSISSLLSWRILPNDNAAATAAGYCPSMASLVWWSHSSCTNINSILVIVIFNMATTNLSNYSGASFLRWPDFLLIALLFCIWDPIKYSYRWNWTKWLVEYITNDMPFCPVYFFVLVECLFAVMSCG